MNLQRNRPRRLKEIIPISSRPLYFVTAVTWHRQRILATPETHAAFVTHAQKQERLGIAVGRYVLLPDHIHFFVAVDTCQTLSESVKHLKQSVTKAIRAKQPELRVWQPGFFDHVLRTDESYGEKWQYVRQNPMRAGLVTNPEEWAYQGEVVKIDRA